MEQVKGIEPSCSAWEADILPLNYTCTFPENAYTIPHLALICKCEFELMKFRTQELLKSDDGAGNQLISADFVDKFSILPKFFKGFSPPLKNRLVSRHLRAF